MGRKSAEGSRYKEETFENCPIKNIECTGYAHCHIDGHNSCPIYFKYEINKIKENILPQVRLIEDKSKIARDSMLQLIKKCGRLAYKPELLKFAAECLGEITRKEYNLWKDNGGSYFK